MNHWKEIFKNNGLPWTIMYICSGNIMRSAFAEYYSKYLLNTQYPHMISKIKIISGACVYKNDRIHSETLNWLRNVEVDVKKAKNHIPRHFDGNYEFFNSATILIAMTQRHVEILEEMWEDKVFLLSEIAIESKKDVKDPYFNSNQTNSIIKELKEWIEISTEKIVNLV